ncbi:hypothetical protein B484DRAFT_434534, partial [Ochromonadaceae sp. CCMP2298]
MVVLGTALNLGNQAALIVFISLLVFLMMLEGALHLLEAACQHRGLHGLIKKLYREFMIMGFISFGIFLLTEIVVLDGEWFLSFEFAHIVLLFVGLNFVVEAFLLVFLIDSRNKTLLRYDNYSSEALLLHYLDLQNKGGYQQYLFNYGPVSIPVPELRGKIEYKIIQEFFVRSYNLPAEFKFANYQCALLKTFLVDMIEVRPVSWLLVAVLAVVNWLRIYTIDPLLQSSVCRKYGASGLQPSSGVGDDGGHRLLRAEVGHVLVWAQRLLGTDDITDDHIDDTADDHADDGYVNSYGQHVCQEYTLRYVFAVSMLVMLYLLGVFLATELYMQRLLCK